MLIALSIRDVVLVDRLDLTFHSGLCVLTGETGAGKSILLDALGLALGARSDSALVRSGAKQATVSANFEVATDHPAHALLREQGLESDGSILVRRVVSRDGRSRAFVNDQPTSIGLLRQLGDILVEVQGHFEQHGLLNPRAHRGVLDDYGELENLVAEVGAAHTAWRQCRADLKKMESEVEKARADEDFLRHALDELKGLDPQKGEEKSLAEHRAALANKEKLVAALNDAGTELAAGRGVEDSLRAAQRHLEKIADKAGGLLDPAVAALGRAIVEAGEAASAVAAAGGSIEADSESLQKLEDRLFALRDVARKHRTEVDALAELRDDIEAKLAALDDRGGELDRMREHLAAAREAYRSSAETVGARRREAATRLDAAVAAELPPLKLEKARFRTVIDTLEEKDWSAGGMDRVAFEVATNPGAEFGPISRIASAGELSRFMLALKVVLSSLNSVPTLVFDEVDSGIGGATAHAVGERLARLGEGVQVLVVTHSPQVAARGRHHWRVQKSQTDGATVSLVDKLIDGDRREEIARMLSGKDITDEARAAADRLISGGEL